MKISSITSTLLLLWMAGMAQPTMRPLAELINKTDPGWPLVQQWIDSATNKVEVLKADSTNAAEALWQTQVTTRSPMGAIIYSTGGILIDGGWIRILGSGNPVLKRSLPAWNKGKTFADYGQRPGLLLVADDAIGGFFAINGGALGKDAGKMYYLSPDNLQWEALDLSYSDFLDFCFRGSLDKFYTNLRWKTWQKDLAGITGDQVFMCFPYLWTTQGKDIEKVSKDPVPVEEQYTFSMQSRKNLGISK